MRLVCNVKNLYLIWIAFFCSLGSAASAQISYPIGAGDVVRISFLSNPNFDRSVQVEGDGSMYMPLLGQLSVQGQTINELREQIAILITGSVFRERQNGEYLFVTVEPDEVFVEIERYRPVFVDGAVNAPGSQDFLVGMTARQAIAAAHGVLDVARNARDANEVRNHPTVLMAELVGVLAEIAVHETILSGSDEIDFSELQGLDAPRELIDNAIELARGQVETSGDILVDELSFLDTAIEEAEARVIASLRHEEAMSGIAATEQAEVERVEALVARRIVSSDTLTQSRRLYLQAIERLGSVQADRLAAEADRRALVLERNQALRERALEMQARLQELSQQASQLRVRIELSSSSGAGFELDQDPQSGPSIMIFRHSGGQAQELDASPETLLLPGDVVNVRF